MLHHRLLINTSLSNTVKKIRHLKDISPITSNFFLFLSCIFYFVEQIKERKDLTFEVYDPSTCLLFLLFLNNRSIVHFCKWGLGGLLMS